jgi:hypothetical protein
LEKSSQVITIVVASVVCLFQGEVQGKKQTSACRFLLNTIPMGTNGAPLLAYLSIYAYEIDCLDDFPMNKEK